MKSPPNSYKVDVFASHQVAKIEHALQEKLSKMQHTPIHIHRTSSDWDAQVSEQLCQQSIWGDAHVVVLHIEEKELKMLNQPWFSQWLEQSSPHHLIIALLGAYATKQKILQHKKICLHNLYDRENTLTPSDKQTINHDPEGLLWLEKLKSQQPLQYEQWMQTQEELTLQERLQTLQTYYHTQSTMMFLTWVQVLVGKQSLSVLLNIKTPEMMECFTMVSAWVRSGLLDEETSSGPSSGLMRWPDAKLAWASWQKKSSRIERYRWYLQWIQQEGTLKGMNHPLTQHHAWQACIQLTQSWKHLIEKAALPSRGKGQ